MKEQMMWLLWYVVLGVLPLLVSAMAIKELRVGYRAETQQRTKR